VPGFGIKKDLEGIAELAPDTYTSLRITNNAS